MIGSRRRPISRDEARRLLAEGLRACTHCQPDTQLHIIDLAARGPVRHSKSVGSPGRGESNVVAGAWSLCGRGGGRRLRGGHHISASGRRAPAPTVQAAAELGAPLELSC
ncbi:hypothetical protein SCYAM73S_05941 [Streptomyces cyaneofuscatus]